MAKPDSDKVAQALGARRGVPVSATPATGPLDWLALAEQVHRHLRGTGGDGGGARVTRAPGAR
jgi:hypothetical protein